MKHTRAAALVLPVLVLVLVLHQCRQSGPLVPSTAARPWQTPPAGTGAAAPLPD